MGTTAFGPVRVFYEFAVFDPGELKGAVYSHGRIVWMADGLGEDFGIPSALPQEPAPRSIDLRLGEALTNLYVGLQRDRRGEKLSAMRFIQGFAVDRVLELAAQVESPTGSLQDPLDPPRRFELRFPEISARLPPP